MPESWSRGRAAGAVVGRAARSVATELLEERRLFSTFIVTTLDGEGGGSLWQAVQDANAAPGADVITFQETLTGTITTPGRLLIKDDLDIQGPGAGAVTVSPLFDEEEGGVNAVAVIDDRGDFDPPAPDRVLDVRIADLTLAEGNRDDGGGGLVIDGENVVLERVVIRDCGALGGAGGGIANYGGNLTILSSTITDNNASGSGEDGGGGVYSAGGTLTIRYSTISDNSSGGGATFGGGVFVKGGAAVVENSTISGNRQSGTGGGVAIDGGTLAIRNSTVAHNRASAGLSASPDGGGGLYVVAGQVTLESTLFADNQAQQTGGDPFFDSDVVREGGTLSGDHLLVEKAPAAGTFTAAPVDSLLGVDALLGELTDNGGPTPTHALLENSPAIDAGDDASGSETDQRGEGFPRTDGVAPDIGAVESVSDDPVVVAPEVTSVSPSPVVAGAQPQTITINGTGFAPDASVRLVNTTSFDEVISFPTVVQTTATQITIQTTIASAAGTYSLEVTNPDAAASGPFEFAVEAAPPAAGVIVGEGGAKSAKFTDADGTAVTVTLKGGGAAELTFDGTDVQSVPGRSGIAVTGTDVSLASVALAGTTARSTLTIKTKGGDGGATLGALTGETPLARLAAGTTDLTGTGIALGDAASIGNVLLGDLATGTAIGLPGSSGVTLKLGAAGESTAVAVGGAILSLTADAIAGRVTAASFGAVKVGGSLSGELRTPGSIKSVTAGSILGGRVFAGVRDDLSSLPAAAADFTSATSSIGSVAVKGKAPQAFGGGSMIAAPSVGKVTLGTPALASAGAPFGIAGDAIRSVTAAVPTTVSPNGKLKLTKLDSPDESETIVDFNVRVF